LYRHLEHRLAGRVLGCLQRRYPEATLPRVVVEQPPKVELGDFAIPMFPFAKPLALIAAKDRGNDSGGDRRRRH
jgi:arginyl-tRNA synthetase